MKLTPQQQELVEVNRPLALFILKQMRGENRYQYQDYIDLIGVCYLALCRAAYFYKPGLISDRTGSEVGFATYAGLSIRRACMREFSKVYREKHFYVTNMKMGEWFDLDGINEVNLDLMEELKWMTTVERTILELRIKNHSYIEIGKLLGKNYRTVKSLWLKTRKKLYLHFYPQRKEKRICG